MFAIVQTHNCPDHLYGYLARFMMEVDSNLFVAKMSRKVADKLWERISETTDMEVSFVMITTSNTEQGYAINIRGGQNSISESDGFFSIAGLRPKSPCK